MDDISKMGYKDNSPYKDSSTLEIQSPSITMRGVSKKIIGIDDNGKIQIMYPEKDYYYPNTDKVTEIPFKQKGGQINGNMKKKYNFREFESYMSDLSEDEQNQLIDYMEGLNDMDRQKFMTGGETTWTKYQKGGYVDTIGTTESSQFDYQTKGKRSNEASTPRGLDDSGREVLSKGSKGREVTITQYFLKSKGFYKGEVNGIYGSKTEKAVKEYQKWFNDNSKYSLKYTTDGDKTELIGGPKGKKIAVDGIIGDQTRSALMYREMPESKPKETTKPEIVEVYPGQSLISYNATDSHPNAGPVSMDYAGGLSMAALAVLGMMGGAGVEGSLSSETSVVNNLTKYGLKPEQSIPNSSPNFVPKNFGNPGIGGRAFQPRTPSSYGTRVQYQDGGSVNRQIVEVEDNETVKQPNGELYQFNGATHAQGGIDAALEPGSKIFSEYLKARPEVIKAVTGRDTKQKMSYADLSKKFDTTKWSKILQNPDSDKFELETASLKMAGNNAMLETIFSAQELDKQKDNKNKYQNGGKVLASDSDKIFFDPITKTWVGRRDDGSFFPKDKTIDFTKQNQNPFDQSLYGSENQLNQSNTSPWNVQVNAVPGEFIIPPKNPGDLNPEGSNQTLDIVEPQRNNKVSPVTPVKTQSTTGNKPIVTKREVTTDEVPILSKIANFNQLDTKELPDQVTSENAGSAPDISDYISDTTSQYQDNSINSTNKFGISPKLIGTLLDIGLAASDKLTVQNPQFRDLRKYPIFSRFVDFEDKEVSRNYALNIQQIQNSNLPEQVKQSRIADLNAQLQDYQAKIDYSNVQRYEQKIGQDTEKLQSYINANIDQNYQDIERYNAQKARVDYLRDQFKAQKKSRIVNSIRSYMDYVDDTNMKNQIYADNYKVNPYTGKVQFTGQKTDPLKSTEQQLNQYAQNSKNQVSLPNGASLTMLNESTGIVTDSTGKTEIVKLK